MKNAAERQYDHWETNARGAAPFLVPKFSLETRTKGRCLGDLKADRGFPEGRAG